MQMREGVGVRSRESRGEEVVIFWSVFGLLPIFEWYLRKRVGTFEQEQDEKGVDEDEKKAGRSSRTVAYRFSSQLEETDNIIYLLRKADPMALHLQQDWDLGDSPSYETIPSSFLALHSISHVHQTMHCQVEQL